MSISVSQTKLLLVNNGPEPAVLSAALTHTGWNWTTVPTPIDALRAVRLNPGLDAVLLCVTPQTLSSCVEFCRSVKLDARWGHISILGLLSLECSQDAVSLYRNGIDDAMRSFVNAEEVELRLDRALRTRHAMESLEDSHRIIQALANAVEGKDIYTCGHVDRVAAYSVEIGRRLGLCEDDLRALQLGGAVHDIGKIGVPDQILNKESKLTDEEFAIMRRHPLIGHDILKSLRTFACVLPIVRWHHEKPNGRGYPDGLIGDQIPISARIVAVADVFDALSTDRTYRKALPLPKCCEIMTAMADEGDLDVDLVRTLAEMLSTQSCIQAA